MRIIEQDELARLRAAGVPRHVACIMDGNRRWAASRALGSNAGHAAIAPAIRSSIESALSLGVEWLTFYAFSTENWGRSADELAFLMELDRWLLPPTLVNWLVSANVRVRFIGSLSDRRVPESWRQRVRQLEDDCRSSGGITACIALNYGGRAEISDGLRRALAARDLPPDDDRCIEDWARNFLADPEMPDVDLVIRAGSESRLSNFLPWHAAYAELVVAETLWPDFRGLHLASAISEYQTRQRRFGANERLRRFAE